MEANTVCLLCSSQSTYRFNIGSIQNTSVSWHSSFDLTPPPPSHPPSRAPSLKLFVSWHSLFNLTPSQPPLRLLVTQPAPSIWPQPTPLSGSFIQIIFLVTQSLHFDPIQSPTPSLAPWLSSPPPFHFWSKIFPSPGIREWVLKENIFGNVFKARDWCIGSPINVKYAQSPLCAVCTFNKIL